MALLFWISAGGALGTAARYLVTVGCLRLWGEGFPFGTLAVNALGSFLVCALMQIALTTSLLSPTLRLALTTGVMGGFTTFSAFSYETLRLLQDGPIGLAALNVFANVAGCLLAACAGAAAGRWLSGA